MTRHNEVVKQMKEKLWNLQSDIEKIKNNAELEAQKMSIKIKHLRRENHALAEDLVAAVAARKDAESLKTVTSF
jgi:SMC interacting uncharacterized protein involved in chromosome segregation